MKNLIKNSDIILIDTCALLNEGFWIMLKNHMKDIDNEGKPLIIHKSVLNEMINISLSKKHSKNEMAKKMLPVLSILSKKNVFRCVDRECDSTFADAALLEYILRVRNSKSVSLITFDKALIADTLLQNQLTSYKGKVTKAYSISEEGKLYERTINY